MLKQDQTLTNLRANSALAGKLVWIGIRPAHHVAMIMSKTATLITNVGIEGDHSATQEGKKRQVSLIQAEHLDVIATLSNDPSVLPDQLRRNLMIEGINVLSLKDQIFMIGNCILEGTGACHPCSRMEEVLGKGGYNAMRGHGGITARILKGGIISTGNSVSIKQKKSSYGD